MKKMLACLFILSAFALPTQASQKLAAKPTIECACKTANCKAGAVKYERQRRMSPRFMHSKIKKIAKCN